MIDSSGDSDIEYAAAALVLSTSVLLLEKEKQKRKKWCRKWLQRRSENGILNMLNTELLPEDPTSYRNFVRLPYHLFTMLLNLIEKDIEKQDTVMRDSITAQNRLQVTLRFLATGETFRSLMYSTRIHESTISRFIPEVCHAIYKHLKPTYLKIPNTVEEWKTIAKKFYDAWDFPHCLGALDGRHIKFRPPRSAGSYYYNYKGDHSIVLLGLADAEYKFIYANVGTNGRISDGGTFRNSALSEALSTNTLNFPAPEPLPGRSCSVPYVVVADDAFPLSSYLLKPYPHRGLSHDCRIFNYRLSRARRIIENAFGILANRFRVLLNPITLGVEKVEVITLACIALHNFLATENSISYLDIETSNEDSNLQHIVVRDGNRCSKNAKDIREEFKIFFNSTGAREWQEDQVQANNM